MRFLAPAVAAGLIGWSTSAAAQTTTEAAPPLIPGVAAGLPDAPRWRMVFSPLALHYSGDAAHKPVVLLALERERTDGVVWGASVFSNSFGQPSTYLFGGQRLYHWSSWEPLYGEWSAGLLYGYVGQYKDKVPLNYKGFSPGITAGLGWQLTPTVAAQVHLLGNAGLLLSVRVDLR
jgi:hypothetical protein